MARMPLPPPAPSFVLMLAPLAYSQADVVEALARRELHGGHAVEHVETHVSHVFLAGDRVLKVKKAVKLPFGDLTGLERRRVLCHEEVRLNRRLAPDVYLGVRAIVWRGEALVLGDPDDPRAVEYAVEMRRLDERDSLASRLERGVLTAADVRAVARRLAEFHAGARPVTAERALSVLRESARETFGTLRDIAPSSIRAAVEDGALFAQEWLGAHAGEVAARAHAGRFVEGHGDLRAEHVFIENGVVRVIDCAELEPRLREVDVGADLSFLVMDLDQRGASDLAAELVDAYRAAGGDPGPDPLVAYHAGERAWIRTKVALIRSGEAPYGAAAAHAAVAEAKSLSVLARRFAWRARGPIAIVVCGGAATGKSTLATELQRASGFEVVSSDLVRKSIVGLMPSERGGPDLYGDAMNVLTYATLADRAVAALERHGGVIVDATFRRRAERRTLVAAATASARVVFVECRAPAPTVEERARRREDDPHAVSDAGPAVALRHLTEFEPFTSSDGQQHVVLMTTRPPAALVRQLERAVRPAETTDATEGSPPMPLRPARAKLTA
jgi:uncharacterized protein